MKKKQIFKKKIILFFTVGVILSLLLVSNLFAQSLNINLVAVNGTEEDQDTSVKYYLPPELSPDDVLDLGPLKISYDEDKGQYYAHGDVSLAAKESKTLKIKVRDVWKIDPKEVNIIKGQVDKNLVALKNTQYYSSASILRDALHKKLDYILERQTKFSDNIERRIEEYRANLDMFTELKRSAFSADYLSSYPLEPKLEGDDVRLILEVENPSETEVKKVTQKHYLPKEIRARDIVDDQGFDVRFDEKRQQAYLTKTEEFQPGEKKRYVVILKDAWHIPKPILDSMEDRAKQGLSAVMDAEGISSITDETANFLAEKVFKEIKKIRESQNVVESIDEEIGTFRINRERFKNAEQSLHQLERALALVATEKLQKLKKLEGGQVKNILRNIQALRGVNAISKALFGKRLSVTMTWRIVWGILAFIALFTSIHFFTWRSRSKFMGEENAEETHGEIKEVGASDDDEKEEEKQES
ncbi:MAG: hypothetical protein P9M07_03270 [Candidatus Aceula meridiana]|nr:hypothetical protein [Candidatus Aceula meridiana]